MHKIDTGGWGEFRLGDLWDVQNTWVYGKNKKWVETEILNSESIPVISGITDNNGVYYWTNDITLKSECFEDCLTITTRGEYSGTLKYHKGKFVLANNILAMPMPNLSEYACKFLIVVINALGYGGYSNYPTKNTLENDIIKLPIDSKGNPDWQYMEDYMRNIEVRVSDSLSKLASVQKVENSKINIRSWRKFELRKLFGDCKKGSRLVQAERIDGDVPLVTAGYENVGITSNIGNTNMEVFKDCISIDMFGNCFYRDYKFNADDNVLIFAENIKNKYVSMYIAGVVGKAVSGYDYTNQYRINNYNRQEIKLPTTSSGEPDWQYMEEYMKNIESKVKRKIDMLIQI